jgi:hypothetical protein
VNNSLELYVYDYKSGKKMGEAIPLPVNIQLTDSEDLFLKY